MSVDTYTGKFADVSIAVQQAIESRLLTRTIDGRPYAFDFNATDLNLLEEHIIASLTADSDWYEVISVKITPPTINIVVRLVNG